MIKRFFDIIFSLVAIILWSPILLVCWLLASMDTASNGLFLQMRIGQFGQPFTIYKLRTMHASTQEISAIGAFLRRFKLDELPQLVNVLQGSMSIVGPRPDVAGYYDLLEGKDRLILNLKPGLTSTAAIKYTNEESLLSKQGDPLKFNDTIIFPDKVKMNLEYYYTRSFVGDLRIIWETVVVLFK